MRRYIDRIYFLFLTFVLAGIWMTAVPAHAEHIYVLRIEQGPGVGNNIFPGWTKATMVQFDAAGNRLDSWDLPAGGQDGVTVLGGNDSYTSLRSSTDQKMIVFAGSDGTAGNASGTRIGNVIVNFSVEDKTFDTSTVVLEPGLYRSVETHDGTGYWRLGNSAADGVRYIPHGGTESVNISTSGASMERIRIQNDQLRHSRAGEGGVYFPIFYGLPWPDIPGIPYSAEFRLGEGQSSNYGDFFFLDADEVIMFLYANGQLQVWELEGIRYNRLTGPGQSLEVGSYLELAPSSLRNPGDTQRIIYYTSNKTKENNTLWRVIWNTEERTFGEPEALASAGRGYAFTGVVAIPASNND